MYKATPEQIARLSQHEQSTIRRAEAANELLNKEIAERERSLEHLRSGQRQKRANLDRFIDEHVGHNEKRIANGFPTVEGADL
jgi:hypothetical protein